MKIITDILKRTSALILTAAVVVSLVSCGNKGEGGTTATTKTDASASAVDKTGDDCAALISRIWQAFPTDNKFPVVGGDEAHSNAEGPAEYSIADSEALDAVLGFPASYIDKIDGAASMMHAMNQNTFTCGAYRFKNSDDMEAGIAALKDNILSRRWMCGFPDSLLIMSLPDNYVIAIWGINAGTGIITNFKETAKNTVNGVQVIVEEPIV
jgi:hypothetical protein